MATISEVLDQVSDLVANFNANLAQFTVWQTASPTGGAANADGSGSGGPWYPLTNMSNAVSYHRCLRWYVEELQKGDPGASAFEVWQALPGNEEGTEEDFIDAISDGAVSATAANVTAAQAAQAAAETAETGAEAAASTATTQATAAAASATEAATAETGAEAAQAAAEDADTTATTQATAAAASATAAASSATAAATAETGAETAQAAAEAAQAAAEAARDEAQEIADFDPADYLAKAGNLAGLADAGAARGNLGLGDAATKSVGTAADTVAAGDDSRITGAAQKSANLSDLANAATARENLGLGDAATKDVGTAADTVAAGNDSRIVGSAQQGVQEVWIPAAYMTPRATNPPADSTTELATNKVMLSALAFDAGTAEYAQFNWRMPKSWDEGTVTAAFVWTAASGSGAVVWGLRGRAVSNDDAMDGFWGTGQTATDTLLTANDAHESPATSAITIGNSPAEGDLVFFEAYRDAANGSDTLGVDALLLGVVLRITTNAGNDA